MPARCDYLRPRGEPIGIKQGRTTNKFLNQRKNHSKAGLEPAGHPDSGQVPYSVVQPGGVN